MEKISCKYCKESLKNKRGHFCNSDCREKYHSKIRVREFKKKYNIPGKCFYCSKKAIGIVNKKFLCSNHFPEEKFKHREKWKAVKR